jgi:hypothetical protein
LSLDCRTHRLEPEVGSDTAMLVSNYSDGR